MGKIHTNASNKMMMMVIYKYMDVKQVLTNICNSFCYLSIVVKLAICECNTLKMALPINSIKVEI